ncbi:Imm1 family immunity protein [Actinokineospora sp. NPDC004072]
MTLLIFWYAPDQEDDHIAATPAEIDAALDHIATLAGNVGVVAEITREDDDTDGLYAGLNGHVGTLHYVGPGAGLYSRSPNPATDSDGTALTYDHQWNVMEFPPDSELPIADIRAAVHEYAHTGTRPTCVEWQEWSPPRGPDTTPALAPDDPAWGSPSHG